MAAKSHPYKDVVLGFVEPANEETTIPSNFASKAGGLPVWLYRKPKPPPPVTRCSNCLQPDRFLLQVYAPIEEDDVGHDQAFHRVLYVSVCQNSACLSDFKGVSVIRAQLPRRNPFYSFNGDEDTFDNCSDNDESCSRKDGLTPSCDVCGYLGNLSCSGCRRARYCSKRCQKDDWVWAHRTECSKMLKNETNHTEEIPPLSSHIAEQKRELWRFPEMEIVTDRHCTPPQSESDEDDGDGNDDENEAQDRREPSYVANKCDEEVLDITDEKIVKGTFQDADEEELPEELFTNRGSTRVSDRVAQKFSRVVGYEPEQVIRYERGGRPLWGGLNGRCALPDVEACENCGCPRKFELQIMPQLLYLLERHRRESKTNEHDNISSDPKVGLENIARRLRDDADWLTIVILTCAKSCLLEEGSYAKECAWVQRAL